MKTFLKKNLIGVFALLVGIGTMSFKILSVDDVWHYTGDDPSEGEFAKSQNWALGEPEEPYNCVSGGNLPCKISVPASNPTELEEYLEDMSNDDVLNINQASRRFATS